MFHRDEASDEALVEEYVLVDRPIVVPLEARLGVINLCMDTVVFE